MTAFLRMTLYPVKLLRVRFSFMRTTCSVEIVGLYIERLN